jgi:hypothetical protein
VQFRRAIDELDKLTAVEPNNARWQSYGFGARAALVEYLLASGRPRDAISPAEQTCATVQQLLTRKVPIAWGRSGTRDCWIMRAQVALATGGAALDNARQAVGSALAVRSSDPVADRFALAKAYRVLGDAQRAARDFAGAQAAWRNALAALPAGVSEKPAEMDEHSTILRRVGRGSEAQPLQRKLRSTGYRLAI